MKLLSFVALVTMAYGPLDYSFPWWAWTIVVLSNIFESTTHYVYKK